MRVLRSRVGIGLLGAAFFDDILVVLGQSIFVAMAVGSGGLWSIAWIALRMLLYIGIAAAVGMTLLPKLSQKVDRLPICHGLIAFILIVALFFAFAAEVLGGMAAITGAFMAGLIFARSPFKDRIETGVSTLAYSFFVPIFFVSIGLAANARVLTGESLWLLLAMIDVAVFSEDVGAKWITISESTGIGRVRQSSCVTIYH